MPGSSDVLPKIFLHTAFKVPFSPVKSGTTVLDPGLTEQRSHYGPGAHNTGTLEAGRNAGGCIQKKGSAIINQVQTAPGHACIAFVAP
jgi:hypothetical protein